MLSPSAVVGGASERQAPAPLELVGLTVLAARTQGSGAVSVGLIDGPVDVNHPDFSEATLRVIGPPRAVAACEGSVGIGCLHGTFTAGILAGRRASSAPAICPGSPLLIRPIFDDANSDGFAHVAATPTELATAIVDCVAAGARVVNVSAELVAAGSSREQALLGGALDRAARGGAIVVVAAGNRARVGGSVLARHPWVLPVAACDRHGRPLPETNLGASVGQRGVLAPGEEIVSLAPGGRTTVLSGTSASAAFVSGAIALAWSLAPMLAASDLRWAVTRAHRRRRSVVPPLLSAPAILAALNGGGSIGHE
jgi:subtilisin family serine protease